MSKRVLILILVACLFTSSYADTASTELPSVCENIDDWLVSSVPLGLIQLFCTVVDDGLPVGIEQVDASDDEDVRQHFLLLIARWSLTP